MSNQNSSQPFTLHSALFNQVAAHLRMKLVGPAGGLLERVGESPIILVDEEGKTIHRFNSADDLVDALLKAKELSDPSEFNISEAAIKSATKP
jgi:nucleoside-diphosphate-sugar epimerase